MYDALYDKGIAVGEENIAADSMVFRYRDEVFEFPVLKLVDFAKWNGYFYEARVDDLRKLEAEAATAPPG